MGNHSLIRLNIGAGKSPLAGYRNLDAKTGDCIFPLPYADGSVDEIRASHVLEHFSHREAGAVLQDWVRCLKFDGVLKIAVPDFELIASQYLAGQQVNVQGLVMGGHVDEHDRHGTIWDAEALTEAMTACGLWKIETWRDDAGDCSSLPVSLNLKGRKRFRVRGVMSVPRLGFMDNFFSAFDMAKTDLMSIERGSGAFWGQSLEAAFEAAMAKGCDAIFALDYDTVFKQRDVAVLTELLMRHPEADAIASLQASRAQPTPLIWIDNGKGQNASKVERSIFDADLVRLRAAHFGCTIIRASSLAALPRPWFRHEPAADGRWGPGRVDDDIWFWRQMERAGQSLFLAPRVVVGHLELMVKWPSTDFEPVYQLPADYFKGGPPQDVWK